MTEISADMIAMGSGDSPIAAKSRALSVGFRGSRAAPDASAADPRDFDADLLGLFAEGQRSCAVAMAALGAIFAAIALAWLTVDAVIIWLCLNLTALTLTQLIARRFPRTARSSASALRWRRDFIVAEAVQGVIWAMLVELVGQSGDPAAVACAVVMGLLVAAMAATISPCIPAAAFGVMAPIALTILTFTRQASLSDGTMQLIILACGAQLYFILLARKLYAAAVEALSFQGEKDELIAELEQSKANSDLARRRAEEANLAKSRFLATMSHELRTPLNAILGFSEVMKGELFGAHIVASYKEYSNDIHSSGHHLLMLINEILDLSRIEAGRFELKEEPVALDHIVEDCRHLLMLRAKKRNIAIHEAVEANLPRIWADERALRQVTLNLLSNAIKFTPHGGSIKIRIGWTTTGGQYLAVRDTGPGIPDEEIPIVMSSFGRGALAQKNAEEGSGLGLPIVKGLVELHGGTFTLKSKVHEGTEVIVIFPPGRVIEPSVSPEAELTAARMRRRARREAHSAA
ncbi:sensor histidine kinase [Methylocella tundrae]|uniref:histidine kinase n=1 Tax=Methylocella tundrae TaxID=227605 RepID=A0A4V6YUK4_METTU|nr:HAMP domain-containing sensor histidine kinase [Methylocella tundrae]WPP04499.1 HAMP domain-containing sensor histidine kinase [Methylocella tundrae]VFU10894.1 Two-component sensor histidine kinase [Methylocella tundrae]